MLKIENLQRLDLGIQGENEARAIEIDCGLWKALWPNGAINIFHKRPGDTEMDVTGAQYDYETGILRWEPTGDDTYYDGEGEAEIRLTEDGVIKKAAAILTMIHSATVGESGTIPSIQQAYLDEIGRLAAVAVNADNEAEAHKNAAESSAKDAEAWARGTQGGTEVPEEHEAHDNNAKYYAERAAEDADDAEAWARGTRDETPVGNQDETYQNNAKYYKDQAGLSAAAANGSARNAAESESRASHWAELAQQGAETSGFAWFDIHDDDGHMYVTVSPKLNGIVQFVINESTGNLVVTVNG